ncbi:uncharacterized protein LOC129598959 [Paramacrobiotus metropolitanus]|uniref:uncharacterized protein LOC129598959 n=1 Tax=Paramacrobiotus metropolitanus TaxID=2943436 RepID=UPI0024460377|nr:uncharacterized protein LOC129598959 [Paramacrobiotus metropolitanus]
MITKIVSEHVPAILAEIVDENHRLKSQLTIMEAQIKELQESQKKYDEFACVLSALSNKVNMQTDTQATSLSGAVESGRLSPQPSGFRLTIKTPASENENFPPLGSPQGKMSTPEESAVAPLCFDSPTSKSPDTRDSWATVAKKKKVVRGTRNTSSDCREDIVMSTLQKRTSKADKEKEKKDFCLHGIPPLDPTRHQTLDDYSKDLKNAIESNGISVRFVSIYTAKKGGKNSLFARVGSFAHESDKMFAAENWPSNIGVREWLFAPKDAQ